MTNHPNRAKWGRSGQYIIALWQAPDYKSGEWRAFKSQKQADSYWTNIIERFEYQYAVMSFGFGRILKEKGTWK